MGEMDEGERLTKGRETVVEELEEGAGVGAVVLIAQNVQIAEGLTVQQQVLTARTHVQSAEPTEAEQVHVQLEVAQVVEQSAERMQGESRSVQLLKHSWELTRVACIEAGLELTLALLRVPEFCLAR